MRHWISLLLLLCCTTVFGAEEIPSSMMARFMKALSGCTGSSGRVACKDSVLKADLLKLGVKIDPNAPLAYADSEEEVTTLRSAKRIVVCRHLDWLPKGGSIAVVVEEGKPSIYLHMRHIEESGIVLSPAVLKLSYRIAK